MNRGQINFRVDEADKEAWTRVAGGNLSGWIKRTLNEKVGRGTDRKPAKEGKKVNTAQKSPS